MNQPPRTFKLGDQVLDASNPKIMLRIVSFDWSSATPYGVTTMQNGWVPESWVNRAQITENLNLWTM